MKLLRAALDWIAFYFLLLVLGVSLLSWSCLAFVIRRLVSRARGRRIGRRAVSWIFRRFFALATALGVMRLELDEISKLDQRDALILAPNHPSVLDALILISRLDNLTCIMKASLLDSIFLGAGARLAGYIRDDGPKSMLRLAADDLRRGSQIVIFPEGTRTIAAPVNEFKAGFAAIARSAGVPVQAVFIETNTPYLSKGWSIFKKPPCFPMVYRVRLGQRFEVGDDPAAFAHQLRSYFMRELADAELGDLRTVDPAMPSASYG